MKLAIKLFAQAKELAGTSTVELKLTDNACVADVRENLGQECPALQAMLPHLLIAVDSTYAADEYKLSESNEVACFPPVSGG